MELVSQSPADTHAIAAKLAQDISHSMAGASHATVVALRGELGAGKTTFTQALAQALGVHEKPKSPTFNLIKQYAIGVTGWSLWHMDAYRLNGRTGMEALDLHNLFNDPKNLILVEWPENIGDILPRDHIEVHLVHKGDTKRGITIVK